MRINDEAVKRSMEKMLSNPANARFNINGNNNMVIDGNNNKIEINNYSQPPKTKIKQVDNQYNPDIHVTPEQQFKIKEVVTEIGDMCKGVLNDGKYAYIYARMNKKFKVPRYSLLLQKDFNKIMKHLRMEKAILRKKIMPISATRYKEYTIPIIIKMWHMKKSDLILNYNLPEDITVETFASILRKKRKQFLDKFSAKDIDEIYNFLYKF